MTFFSAVKTYSDPSYIFSGDQDPNRPQDRPLRSQTQVSSRRVRDVRILCVLTGRLWAEIFEVQEDNGDICWGRVSDDVVPVNITCIQSQPTTVFQITAYNRHVEKIFDVRIIQPGRLPFENSLHIDRYRPVGGGVEQVETALFNRPTSRS